MPQGSTGRRVCLTLDECRRGPTPSRRSHLPRACKSAEQEADEDVVEDEGEEKEVGKEEQEEEEEAEESPTNQDDEDGEGVEVVAEGAAYQPMEVAEAAAEAAVEQAVVAQIDHSIEERVKRIRDIWDVPESPMGEPPSSIDKGLTSRSSLSPTSTVQEESPPAIAGLSSGSCDASPDSTQVGSAVVPLQLGAGQASTAGTMAIAGHHSGPSQCLAVLLQHYEATGRWILRRCSGDR